MYMDNTHNTPETGKENPFVDALHESLVTHSIITNPRVAKCGTYYSKERGYFRYRVKCGNIKECPRCRTEGLPKRRQEILTEQEECLSAGGSLYLITGTLKHRKTDSLKFLQGKLSNAVKRLRNQSGWRKLSKLSTMPTKTVYETTYSTKNGYHPHVHMLYGTGNQVINKTQIREALNPYWSKYTGAYLDVTNLDKPTIYINKKEYPWVNVEEWETEMGRMNAEIKERFNKPTLETMLLCYDRIPNFNNPSISKDEIVKVLKNMNKYQSYYLGR